MKKRIALLLAVVLALGLTACATPGTPQDTTHSHSYSTEIIIKEATCTTNGTKLRTCSCGEEKTTTIMSTGHTYGGWETAKEATCTETGTKEQTCSVCGEKQTETINATGHSYDIWETTKEATCTEAGTKQGSCSTCGDKQTETINATGHSYSKSICIYCNATDIKLANILINIERYPAYLSSDINILESSIELYQLTGKSTYFSDIVDSVEKMYGYATKVRDACKGNPDLKLLYDEAYNIQYPVASTSSSYITKVKTFILTCRNICIIYDSLIDYYNIK